MNLLASGKRIEQAAGVSKLFADVLLRVGILRVLQVAVVVNDLVTMQGVGYRFDFGARRTGGSRAG